MESRVIALDVEGTIITGYDFNREVNGQYPAIIKPELKPVLEALHNSGFIVVLATGTDGDNLEYYKSEFQKAGLDQYISRYSPREHSPSDSKVEKLRKYANEYHAISLNFYFYDDAQLNVEQAVKAGFVNAYQVNDDAPLHINLLELAKKFSVKLSEKSPNSSSSVYEMEEVPQEDDSSVINTNESIGSRTHLLVINHAEDTIITGYDYAVGDEYAPAIIHPELPELLKTFNDNGFLIIVLSDTDEDTKKYYIEEFRKAGLEKYIHHLLFRGDDVISLKELIVNYSNRHELRAKDIFFFDHDEDNVQTMKEAGIENGYRIGNNEKDTLRTQLIRLAVNLSIATVRADAAVSQTPVPTRIFPASYRRIVTDKNNWQTGLKALFHDYAYPKWLTFHWNRHHQETAKRIMESLPADTKNAFDYIESERAKLLKTPKINLNGSMIRRLDYALSVLSSELTNKGLTYQKR